MTEQEIRQKWLDSLEAKYYSSLGNNFILDWWLNLRRQELLSLQEKVEGMLNLGDIQLSPVCQIENEVINRVSSLITSLIEGK